MKEKERHLITIYPDMVSGEPTIDHHRITAAQMACCWWSGNYTLKAIEENWPGMSRGAILVSCWYMARYGSRTWRKRWKEWLEVASDHLWHGRYKTCPMPPQLKEEMPK